MSEPFHGEVVRQLDKHRVDGDPAGAGVLRILCNSRGYLSDLRDGPDRSVTVLDPPITDPSDPGACIECTAALPTPCAAGSI